MSENAYSSKKVLNKAIFNIGFQIVPIAAALILTPYLIETMGKDSWAKYSIGISLIFLSNYFSFGIGPTLNRRVSEIIGLKENYRIKEELKECVSFSYLLGTVFFVVLQLVLYAAYSSESFSILQSIGDYTFFFNVLCVFFLAFIIIPYRSLLESFSDFYFLAIIRAFTAAMLFVIPFMYSYFSEISLKGIAMILFVFYVLLCFLYFFRIKSYQKKFSFQVYGPLEWNVVKRMFKFEMGFLKETIWFSIFFLTSALVLFFDRFYYPMFFDTKIISDQVTMLDLFNRVAIITGTISLVYFSAISVWYQEKNISRIKTSLRLQLIGVGGFFTFILIFSYLFLDVVLKWWLQASFSAFIYENAYRLLIGVLMTNYTILLIRPLQAIGKIKTVSIWLLGSTVIYLVIVLFLGEYRAIAYHYLAFVVKALLDMIFLVTLLRRNRIL